MNKEQKAAIAQMLDKLQDIEQEIIDLSENFDFGYSEQSLLSRAADHVGQADILIRRTYSPTEANPL